MAAEGDNFVSMNHSKMIFEKYGGDKNIVIVEGDHNSPRPRFLYDSVGIFLTTTLQTPENWALEEGQNYIRRLPWTYKPTSSSGRSNRNNARVVGHGSGKSIDSTGGLGDLEALSRNSSIGTQPTVVGTGMVVYGLGRGPAGGAVGPDGPGGFSMDEMMAMSMMYGAEYEDDDEGDENEEAFHALLKESYLASLKTANSNNATEALMQRDVQMKLFNLMSGGSGPPGPGSAGPAPPSDLSDAKNGSEREKSLKEKRTNSKKMEAQFADIPQNLGDFVFYSIQFHCQFNLVGFISV